MIPELLIEYVLAIKLRMRMQQPINDDKKIKKILKLDTKLEYLNVQNQNIIAVLFYNIPSRKKKCEDQLILFLSQIL